MIKLLISFSAVKNTQKVDFNSSVCFREAKPSTVSEPSKPLYLNDNNLHNQTAIIDAWYTKSLSAMIEKVASFEFGLDTYDYVQPHLI